MSPPTIGSDHVTVASRHLTSKHRQEIIIINKDSSLIVDMMIVSSLMKFSRPIQGKLHYRQAISRYSTKEEQSEPEIPKNELEDMISAQLQPEKGKIYDKKPFKLTIEAGKKYAWCTCGHSKGQPLCDGSHRNTFMNIKLRPIFFKVKETKEYWLCNCKQSSNRPFCDGTHMREDIQAKIK
ncbi:uncharacterized protein LOC135166855 [Diachasmimorpha longicaudata]|uniref:uncharacterized protein LOC135166855 n=1 Tax=Diachasmimorpha longicaudata TaxID=58733 RepID=UPI0030B878BC